MKSIFVAIGVSLIAIASISNVGTPTSEAAITSPAITAPQEEMAARNPSACRVSFSNGRSSWCGSGAVAGYTEDGDALIVTNAHVSGNPDDSNARRSVRFIVDGQWKDYDATEVIAYGYSNQRAVDWAVLRSSELKESVGIPATPLFKSKPTTSNLQFTGSPRCVWPQTSVDVSLVNAQGVPAGVRLWTPNTIGGQSGSNLRAKIDEDWVGQIILTWSWNGRGAGQETFQVFNNVLNRNTAGPERPEGLVEVVLSGQQDNDAYEFTDGYYETEELSDSLGLGMSERLSRVAELDIWYDPDGGGGVDPPPEGGLTFEERVSAIKLKEMGYDLKKLLQHYESLRLPTETRRVPTPLPAFKSPSTDKQTSAGVPLIPTVPTVGYDPCFCSFVTQ